MPGALSMSPSASRHPSRSAGLARAAALLQERDFGGAEQVVRGIIAADAAPRTDTLLLLAQTLFGTERLAEALDAARQSVASAPANPDTHLQVIVTLLDMGRPDQALTEAQAFADAQGANPDATALLGLVLRRVGRLPEAVEALSRVAAAHPGHVPAHLWLAHALHDIGRNDEAAALYGELVGRIPGLEEAHFGLSNTLADGGRLMEAAQAYARAARSIAGFNQRWPDLLIPVDGLAQPVVPAGPPRPDGIAMVPDGIAMVIAFVPFETPYVPLGPATLKAYVEHTSPHRVTAVDLNARFFQSMRQALAARTTPFQLGDTAGFLAACDTLTRDGPDFYQTATYAPAARVFEEQLGAIKLIFTRQNSRIAQMDGPIPWHARAMARALVASSPAVVGLSAMYDAQLPTIHAIARAIRRQDPKVKIVLGGGAFAAAGIEALLAAPHVDYVILQDGEETLAALLSAVARGEGEPDISGLCYRRADGSFVVSDEARPIKQDAVPPADFSDYDLGAYFNPRPVLPLLTSRGCYWRRCTFCNHFASYAGTYKAQSIDRVVDELEHHMVRYGVRHFTLVDEMISAARFRKIGEEILARGLDVTYYALAKPTADFTPDILDVMYRSGCRYILWGQESGNDRMLGVMDKGNTVASSHATLQAAAAAGLRNHLFLMVGYPTETVEELEDTIRFLHANRNAIDQIHSGPFLLEKGTPLYARPEEFGISKVYDRRVYGGCQLVRFEVASGLRPAQSEAAETALRRSFFPHFNSFSQSLGSFRDHALIIYSRLARAPGSLPPPDAGLAMAAVRDALARLDG